jgi:hypothetical protein
MAAHNNGSSGSFDDEINRFNTLAVPRLSAPSLALHNRLGNSGITIFHNSQGFREIKEIIKIAVARMSSSAHGSTNLALGVLCSEPTEPTARATQENIEAVDHWKDQVAFGTTSRQACCPHKRLTIASHGWVNQQLLEFGLSALESYGILILNHAHVLSVHTELLMDHAFGLIASRIDKEQPYHIIIISATAYTATISAIFASLLST